MPPPPADCADAVRTAMQACAHAKGDRDACLRQHGLATTRADAAQTECRLAGTSQPYYAAVASASESEVVYATTGLFGSPSTLGA